jgi:hypothetical protein
MERSSTQSISIDVPTEAVLDLVADPRELPRWAPAFARAVRPAGGDHWLVDTGDREARMRVRVSRELGTVDFLLPGADTVAFSRAVPNGRGTEYVVTRFFPDVMPDAEVAEQKAMLAVELQTLRALCEQPRTRAAA